MKNATLFYKEMFSAYKCIYDTFVNIADNCWIQLVNACDRFGNMYPCVYCDELAVIMLEEKSRSKSVNHFDDTFFQKYEDIFIKYQNISSEDTRKEMVKECNLLYKEYKSPFCLALGKALIDEKQREIDIDTGAVNEPDFSIAS